MAEKKQTITIIVAAPMKDPWLMVVLTERNDGTTALCSKPTIGKYLAYQDYLNKIINSTNLAFVNIQDTLYLAYSSKVKHS